jgi:hypothetical protein
VRFVDSPKDLNVKHADFRRNIALNILMRNRAFHYFIILTMIVPLAHDSVSRRKIALGLWEILLLSCSKDLRAHEGQRLGGGWPRLPIRALRADKHVCAFVTYDPAQVRDPCP